jgi:hypothetical protein
MTPTFTGAVMTTHRLLPLLFSLAIASPVAAIEPPAIPADALVAVSVRDLKEAAKHLDDFVAAAKPGATLDLIGRLRKVNAEAGRGLDGFALDKPVTVIAFTFEGITGPTPPWVAVFSVSDAKTFRQKVLTDAERGDTEQRKDGIERAGPWFLVSRPGTVAVTPSEDAARAYRDSKETLSAERLGELGPVMADADVSCYVNVVAINARYGDAARAGVQFADFVLQSGGNGLIPTFDAKQVEVVRYALGGLTQFLADGRALAVGLKLGADGAKLGVKAEFTPGSPTAKRFATDKSVSLDNLATLPAGYTTYVASAWGPAATAALQKLAPAYRAPKGDARAGSAVETYDAVLRAGGVRLGVAGPGASGFVTAGPDAKARTAAQTKVLRTMTADGWAGNLPLAERPGVRDAALEAGGFTLHRATLALDLEAGVETIRDANLRAATLESIRRIVSEKTVLWFGGDGKRYAEIVAAEPDAAAKILGDLLGEANRVSANKPFAATREALPKVASLVVLAEAAPAVASLADYTKSVSGALPAVPGFEIPEFRKVKNPPLSYLGMAVTVDGGGFGLTLVVPAAAAKVAVDATVIPGQ